MGRGTECQLMFEALEKDCWEKQAKLLGFGSMDLGKGSRKSGIEVWTNLAKNQHKEALKQQFSRFNWRYLLSSPQ